MPRPRIFHRDDDERDWRERRGRFAFVGPDQPGRPQVPPAEKPDDPRELTHNRREFGGYWDGPDEPEPITGTGGIVAPKPGVGDDDDGAE